MPSAAVRPNTSLPALLGIADARREPIPDFAGFNGEKQVFA
jgi:hypothetical protein